MTHSTTLRCVALMALAAPALLRAQTAGPVARGPVPAVRQDTTIRYVIPDRGNVKITLRGGFTYGAKLDGRELAIQVKPVTEGLRDPAIADASLPSETVSRYTIIVDDSGDYEFMMTGVMP